MPDTSLLPAGPSKSAIGVNFTGVTCGSLMARLWAAPWPKRIEPNALASSPRITVFINTKGA